MVRWMIVTLVAAGCGSEGSDPGTTDDSEATAVTGATGATGATGHTGLSSGGVGDCDGPLDCSAGCATFDPAATSYGGYSSLAVDCAEGGHALLQDNLFGVHAFFDASGELVALRHFSDIEEFCGETAYGYWEGDPVTCTPTCAYGGFDGIGYATGDPLPDC